MSGQIKNPGRRKFLRKAALAGAAVVAVPLANPARLFAQAANRSRVIIAHGVGVYSLNPYAVNTSPLVAAWGSVMEPLIEADYEKRGYKGVLAESWEMKGAKLHFKLRKGVRFHDGTPLSGKDVIASFKRILTDKASLQAPNLANVKEMDAPDDFNFIVTLKQLDANALEDINGRVIIKQAAAEKMGDLDNRPVGTGPFKFTSWERSGQFVVRRNDGYWGQPARIDEVVYRAIQEDAARIAALEAGQADVISNIPPHEVARLKSNPRLRVQQVQGCGQFFWC